MMKNVSLFIVLIGFFFFQLKNGKEMNLIMILR